MQEGNVKSNGSFLSLTRMRQNPWILATIFLVVVLVVYFFAKGSLTGNVVSESTAAENLISFIEAQGGTAEVVSSVQTGSMYMITVNYQGQEIPVYVTLDGKYIASSLLPLTANSSAQSQSAESAKTVPKTDKPKVDAFVFAYCPYGLQFEKALLPVYDLLKNKADIDMIYIGAMHGEFEHVESLRQIAILNLYNKDRLFAYLKEFDTSADMGNGQDGKCLAQIASGNETCLTTILGNIYSKLGIDKTKVDNYMSKSAEAIYGTQGDLASSLGISGSPTFVINGVAVGTGYSCSSNSDCVHAGETCTVISSSGAKGCTLSRTPQTIEQAICSAFNTAPSECSQSLSSIALSAGFGGTAGTSASSAASCG